MSDNGLPAGWADATIGELVIEKVSQGLPSDLEEFTYVEISDIDRASKSIASHSVVACEKAASRARQQIRPQDVLVSMTRPNLNAVALVPNDLEGAIASTGFDVLRSAGVPAKWLFYLVQTTRFIREMSGEDSSTLYPAVRPADIRGFKTTLPPLPEQERIVAELDLQLSRLDKAVEALKLVQAKLKRYRASVLSTAFPRHRFQSALTSLGDVCKVTGGKRLPLGSKLSQENTGFPYVRVTDFENFSVNDVEIQFVPSEVAPAIKQYKITSDDVYISIAGTIGLVGQVPESLSGANLTENAARIVVGEELRARFLMYQLASSPLQQQIQQGKTATTLSKFGLFRIKDLKIWIPEMKEQERIVSFIENATPIIESMREQINSAEAKMHACRRALLMSAFSGHLVPQDTADEPASILLDRIRTERGAALPKQAARTGTRRKRTSAVGEAE